MSLTATELQHLIDTQITLDRLTEEDIAASWATYMEQHLAYPFTASYRVAKPDGTDAWLRVDVVGSHSNPGDYTGGDYYVEVLINGVVLPAALQALRDIQAEATTLRAIEVLRYGQG